LLEARYNPGTNVDAADGDLLRRYLFTYDRAGNRLSESLAINGGAPTVTNYSYNGANQITNMGFSYDNNGNLLDDGPNTYSWDRANRLLTRENGVAADKVAYAYDGLGNRISRSLGTTSPTVTKYLLDLQPSLAVMLADTTGASVNRYVHGPMGIHAQKDTSGNWEWMAQDGLGSVRGVLDNAVGVLWTGSPAPYGVYFGEVGTRQSPYLFTGEYTDPTAGLVHLRARDYNPALGVFTALDPFEGETCRPMSLNGYSYAEGNSVNWTDPSGKNVQFATALNFGICALASPLLQSTEERNCSCYPIQILCQLGLQTPCAPSYLNPIGVTPPALSATQQSKILEASVVIEILTKEHGSTCPASDRVECSVDRETCLAFHQGTGTILDTGQIITHDHLIPPSEWEWIQFTGVFGTVRIPGDLVNENFNGVNHFIDIPGGCGLDSFEVTPQNLGTTMRSNFSSYRGTDVYYVYTIGPNSVSPHRGWTALGIGAATISNYDARAIFAYPYGSLSGSYENTAVGDSGGGVFITSGSDVFLIGVLQANNDFSFADEVRQFVRFSTYPR
jgi:RHS repeat-associated protein